MKKLAITNKDVADLTKRHQKISQLQSKLMKEKRVLKTTLETKIINQCNLEGQKMKILQSLQYPVTVNITPLKSLQRVTTHKISQSCPPQSKRCIGEIKNENVNKVQEKLFIPHDTIIYPMDCDINDEQLLAASQVAEDPTMSSAHEGEEPTM